jgi:pantoate--beta-alanine ligase
MEIIRMPRIMHETSRRHLSQSKSIGFVPTMGALHEGHLSLVRRARREHDIVVVSVFVNPTQFGAGEDLGSYPRDFDGDCSLLGKEGADIVFSPEAAAIYPDGFATFIEVAGLSDKLCGAFRPGHFRGVATVVCKLFNIVTPTMAYFGQKDYQQTRIIMRMVQDLALRVEVIVGATVREADGLAMSSRNRYLDPRNRAAATLLYRTLSEAARMVGAGAAPSAVSDFMISAFRSEPLITDIQYAGVYNPDSLDPVAEPGKLNLLAVAVRMGSTRLIDNVLAENRKASEK